MSRGTAALSFGPSLIGGVNARLKSVPYATTADFDTRYDLTAIGRSVDGSHAIGGVFGAANDSVRAFGLFSTENGHDKGIPHGRIANTHHDREVYGLGAGIRHATGDWELELRRQKTGPTGNPPFAMDIDFVDTGFSRLAYGVTLADTRIDATIGRSAVDHGMNNFEYRPAPPQVMQYRYTHARAETLTLGVDFVTEAGSGELGYGIDVERNEFDVLINNPEMKTFHVTALPDISTNRTGAYLNLELPVGKGTVSFGARMDHHEHKAGQAEVGPAVPAMPGLLAMQFNSGDRDWSDATTDLLARYWRTANQATWRVSFARKNRVPTYLERYGWLPIAASAGLADGNNYVGDRGLKAEVASISELGVDLVGHRWRFRPSVFYHRVNDYIQGVPYDNTPGAPDSLVERVSGMNGDPTPLQFTNVDAQMYGIDADFGYDLAPRWRLEGVFSVVRGQRRDIRDDLYRTSPDRLSLGLTYDVGAWSVTMAGMAIASQDRVSGISSEQKSSGYGLLSLHGAWRPGERLFISAGVENLANREYADHLAGYNRVRESDVGLGERIPGAGRNVYLRLSLSR